MFIPRYWSEASHREILPERRQVTVHRFGWSSTTQEDADVHARQRLEEALAVLRQEGPEGLAGFTRRERKVAYAGSDGLPIREEIVREWEAADVVVTRNGYGALCLNTTQAMFVDVDRSGSHEGCFGCVGSLVGGILGGILGPWFLDVHWAPGIMLGAFVLCFAAIALGKILHARDLQARSPLRWATRQAETWCESRPDWRVAIYETPAGARLLPLHATFDAGDDRTFEFMAFVRADPLYQRMCRLQKCFRARVSPKPWRVGISDHFRTGGTWPVHDPDKLAVRAEWIRRYEKKAELFASCRSVETVGLGRPDPVVEEIRRFHDELCQAGSRRDLA